MDAHRLDAVSRTLTHAPSRRVALRLLLGSALGGFLLGDEPTQAKKKSKVTLCHNGQTIRVSKKAKKKHLQHGDTRGACPPPPPPVPVLTYQCPGPVVGTVFAGATTRVAQTFTAAQSGSLHQIQFEVIKNAGTTGDFLVELLATVGGVPTNTAQAQTTIPNASVPEGHSSLTATFSGPPLLAGTEYAAAISRPGGGNWSAILSGSGCAGRAFAQNPSGTGDFNAIFGGDGDVITAVTVLA